VKEQRQSKAPEGNLGENAALSQLTHG
jgi:hypothetical protein